MALSGCTAARQSRPYSVYLISKSASTEFWKSVFAGANAAKSEYNVDLTILAPETEEEYEVQNDYVRQAIESRACLLYTSLPRDERVIGSGDRIALAVRLQRQMREMVEEVCRRLNFAARLRDRLSGFQRNEPRQLICEMCIRDRCRTPRSSPR